MLGFTTFSGATLSQATTSALALAYLSTIATTITAESVLYDAKAFITNPSTTSSFTANVLLFDAKANTSVSNVSATITAYDFQDVYGKANAALSSAAYLTIYINNFADVDAQANVYILPAVATIQALDVEYDAKASITPSAVTSSVATSNVDYDAQARYYITTLLATFDQSLEDPIAVTFDYQQYSDSYERNRTLYIVSDVKGHTVYLPEGESTTIYLAPQDTNRTVNIAA